MEKQRKQIGHRISMRRKAMHLTQDKVAEYLDCSNNTVSSIETGKQNITISSLIKLCELLDTTPNDLLLGNMHPDDVPRDIADTLRLCTKEQVDFIRQITEIVYAQNFPPKK